MSAAPPSTGIGARIPRRELKRLLSGHGRYIDDIKLPRMLHACFVRSPHPHAKVISIDKDSALLAHGPLTTAGMGAMTMEFKAPTSGMPRNVAKGDRVQFEFVLPKDGEPTLTSITPVAPVSPQTGVQASRPKIQASGAQR